MQKGEKRMQLVRRPRGAGSCNCNIISDAPLSALQQQDDFQRECIVE